MKQKTTKKQFEQFKAYCEKWRINLGLIDWALFYEIHEVEDAYARTFWRMSDHAATIQFCKRWDPMRPCTDKELERLACHEMCHLVLAPMSTEAHSRYSTEEAIDNAEHSVVRLLEEVLVGAQNAKI